METLIHGPRLILLNYAPCLRPDGISPAVSMERLFARMFSKSSQNVANLAKVGTVPAGGSTSRRPELDGLRGIAILSVVAWHYWAIHMRSGSHGFVSFAGSIFGLTWSGVDLFFVLSGFLIGGILLDQRKSENYFAVFYTRRFCRIVPLYYCVLFLFLLSFLLGPAFTGRIPELYDNRIPSWYYFTFTQNFAMFARSDFGPGWLGVTWSLAIEEQFYILLPFIIRLVPARKLPALLGLLFVLAVALRIVVSGYHPESFIPSFVLMPCRADSLMLGVLVACMVRHPGATDYLAAHTVHLYAIFGFLASVMVWIATGSYQPGSVSMMLYGYSLLALLYASLLLIAISEKRGLVSSITRNPVLRWFGLIAYGAYLLHQPINGLCHALLLPNAAQTSTAWEQGVTVSAFLLTVGLASLSWIYFEKRIVNFGHSFKYKLNMAVTTVAFPETLKPGSPAIRIPSRQTSP
jgi:peptidoglycan/LPS O-acetylase OafA/YrhL